jgi:hypothetical protein
LTKCRSAATRATAKGSLIVPLVAGGGDKGPQLASDAIAQAFWKETGLELGRVAKGQAARLSATGAEAYARASAAAKDSSAKLSFATKTGRGTWRVFAVESDAPPNGRRPRVQGLVALDLSFREKGVGLTVVISVV